MEPLLGDKNGQRLLCVRDGDPCPNHHRVSSFKGQRPLVFQTIAAQFDRLPNLKMGFSLQEIIDIAKELGIAHISVGQLLRDYAKTHPDVAQLMNTGDLVDTQLVMRVVRERLAQKDAKENGFIFDGFPSLGSWVSYALGSEAENLPAYVAIPDPRGVPQAGVNNWGNGFLPAVFQGTAFNSSRPIYNLARPTNVSAASDLAARDALKFLNEKHLEQFPGDTELAARISSYELAARMQLSVPEVSDLSKESATTLKAYGVDDPNPVKSGFAKNCLLARRLLERGVRCVKLYNGAYAMGEGIGNWDGHKKLKEQYDKHAPIFDQPAAALIRDLRQRGLLEDTLVVWCTEFGRMPTFQKGASGRDHNPQGFTVWMTGAGVKPGVSYGATDDLGHKAVENVTTIYDFHATILHLMGLNHERLSYYHNGIDRRLTDVHGHVIRDVLV